MEAGDSRRLTGPNLQHSGPGAVAEVRFESGEDVSLILGWWAEALDQILPLFGLQEETRFVRHYDGGAAIGFSAPVDHLYAATELNEWAIEWANARAANAPTPDLAEGDVDPGHEQRVFLMLPTDADFVFEVTNLQIEAGKFPTAFEYRRSWRRPV